jgi:hypothetical protein
MELLTVLALLALFALLPVTASAAEPITTITVNETTDASLASSATTCESEAAPKGCTLRAAVELANEESKASSGELVAVDVPADTFDDTLGTLAIEEGAQVVVTGTGAGDTIIDGGRVANVFEVHEGASLTLQGLTVRHGEEFFGGGIYVYSYASLTVEDSTITENLGVVRGGGIYADQGAAVTIEASNVSDNETGGYGGGIDAGIGETAACEETAAVAAQRSGRGVNPRQESVPAIRAGSDAEPLSDEPGLTVRHSTIDDNVAEEGNGGGIETWHEEGCEGDLLRGSVAASAKHLDLTTFAEDPGVSIDQSTIAGNTADDERDYDEGGEGGGVFEEGDFYPDPIVNSTIADNVAQRNGGGVGAGYGGTAVLISDTVFGNTVVPPEVDTAKTAKPAIEELAGVGNNLAAEPLTYGLIELRNTIVAEPSSGIENCEGEIQSYVPGAGYNLDYPSSTEEGSSTDTCGLSTEDHDLLDISPDLDEAGLQENGGPTETIALLSTSPAIGVVPLVEDCAETEDGPDSIDQRGEPRPGISGDGCDIGAYEYQGSPAPPVTTPETPPTKTTTSTTTTTTTTIPTPAAGVLPFKAVSPKLCSSLRRLTIHIQNVKQFGIVSAVIEIDGHHKRTLRGKHLSAPINLVGLPLGTYTVEIVAHLRDGRTLHGKRVYHTCVPKKPGHAYLPL